MTVTRYMTSLYREAPRKSWLLRSAFRLVLPGRTETVMSSDGTTLAVRRTGSGVPVVLVHGGLGSKETDFLLVEPALADHVEVWSYDRRGRGGSGDGADYTLDREVQDLAAVVEATGAAPHVVGHSFGAICALLAVRQGVSVRSLVLYEPPFNQHLLDQAVVRQVAEAVERDDLGRAVRSFYTLADVPPEEARLMRSMPLLWRRLRQAARTLPRELAAIQGWRWSPEEWSAPDMPMLLIAGADTTDPVFPTVDDLKEAFPHAEVDLIPGQRHLANGFAPWRFAETVVRFTQRH